MGYRPAGLIATTSLHDHGGECDDVSDGAWKAFCKDVEAAADKHLRATGHAVDISHHGVCLCAECED